MKTHSFSSNVYAFYIFKNVNKIKRISRIVIQILSRSQEFNNIVKHKCICKYEDGVFNMDPLKVWNTQYDIHSVSYLVIWILNN